MSYGKKLMVLSALTGVLALVYILSFVFAPELRRLDSFAWLDPSLSVMADGIEIHASGSTVSLRRENNIWTLVSGSGEFPVRQERVNDLFTLLSQRSAYPVRALSSEARESLGLTESAASRILVSGGMGLPLLDLLVGGEDIMGREVYLRRNGENEIRSGEGDFASFVRGGPAFWYDLRLFPPDPAEQAGNSFAPSAVGIESIQEAEIAFSGRENLLLRRDGGGWIMRGGAAGGGNPPRSTGVEAWLRALIEAEGDDFAVAAPADELSEGSVTLRFGDGTSRTLRIGPALEGNTHRASVSGSVYVYVLSERTVDRLFAESSSFM